MLVKESPREIWDAVLGELQSQVTSINYDTWLRGTVGLGYEGDDFVVGVPSPFAVSWLEQKLGSLIQKTLIGVIGEEVNVCFQIQSRDAVAKPKGRAKSAAGKNHRKPGTNGFNPKYTFQSFIVGNCNRLANAAAQAVAEKPGHIYNPLFIYGGVGLGKTHLLHAIGNLISRNGQRVLYVSTEQFTNEFIKSIKDRKTEEFQNKYRSVDILLIDDIQFIIGKEQTQEGFFHTFNDLHNGSSQIVITSDRPPRSMPLLEDRLRSRFEWGLIADIQPPDLETRIAILQAKSEEDGISVPADVLDFIARKVQKSIRELEGSLNRVVAFARLTNESLTLDLASKALAEFHETTPRRVLTPQSIIDKTAKYFDLEPEALVGRRRDKMTVMARHLAIYLIREETECSFNEIGRVLGNRDHSAILRACEKISLDIDASPGLRRDAIEVRERLYDRGEA